jgi:hypothetical protein
MSSRPVSHVRIVLEALNQKGPAGSGAKQTAKPDVSGPASAELAGSVATSSPASASTAPGAPGASASTGTPASKAAADYAAELAAVKALAGALVTHPQTLHITPEKSSIAAKLVSAVAHAQKSEWPAAMADLAEARAKCVAAKKLADDWQPFAKLRASVVARQMAIAGIDRKAVESLEIAIAAADGQAAASPPNFAGATATLNAAANSMAGWFKGTLTGIKTALAKLKSQSPAAQTFVAKEIAEGTALVAKAEAALAAEAWSELLMCWRAAWNAMGAAERYGQRRVDYDTQRVATVAAIAKVKVLPAVQDSGAALDALLAKADTLAGHDQLKMEEGVTLLKDASTRCEALIKAAATVLSHNTERAAADSELALLNKHSAAAQIAEPLKAISQQLAAAATSATQARASATGPGALWQTALTQVQRARADISATKKLADGLGPAGAAQAAAASGDATAMRKSLTALQADLAAAGKAAHADLAKPQLEAGTKQAAEADKALTNNDTKAAAAFVLAAAKALAQARTIQGQHGQFETTLASTEARLAALRKLPTAKSINAKIEAVEKAVEAAKKQDQGGKAEAAMAALRLANDAAAAADQANTDRLAFDTEAKRVADRIQAEVTDPKLQKTISKITEDAAKQADAFKFTEAGKTLKRAEVEIADLKLRAGMKTTPPDPKLEAIAKQMVADGGAASVDKAIQDSPDGDPSVILALASGRYGKPFSFEDPVAGPEHVKSMKRICEIFATIPDDLTNNPSIKDVAHADSTTSAGGGYTSSTAHIGMEGRVGIQQEFGNNEVTTDPITKKTVKTLPKDIDPDCQPKDGKKKEYLGFAAAHEVGHGVDDKRGFMAKNGSADPYGGWISHGADCQPVADAAGQHIAAQFAGSKFYKTPESKQYTLDKLMNKPANRPAAEAGTPDFLALAAFDQWHALASADFVYSRQSDCDAIQIGDRIYHEAYPRSWVSYKAAARKKGLTGYQFRSPAEWFAELYAGWKTGKLGPKHPALEWLNEL